MTLDRPAALQDRSAVTEDRLCEAAEALLREGGLDACTIQAVAKRAKRSPASVYRRFRDRDALFRAALMDALERGAAASRKTVRLESFKDRTLEGVDLLLQTAIGGSRAGSRRGVRALRVALGRCLAGVASRPLWRPTR